MNTPAVHYVFFASAVFFAALILALQYDLVRNWDFRPSAEKKLQVEEIFILASILIAELLIFAWRRMRDRMDELMRRLAAEREAHLSARKDTLTGLPNRKLFAERAGEALSDSWKRGAECAVLFIDLDGFKPINDTWGHAAGDTALLEVANRLKSCMPENGMVARLGGDEFAVLFEAPQGASAAKELAQNILRVLERPFSIKGQRVTIGATIGIAVGPANGRRAEDLIHAADLAMYEGKRSGRGAVVLAA